MFLHFVSEKPWIDNTAANPGKKRWDDFRRWDEVAQRVLQRMQQGGDDGDGDGGAELRAAAERLFVVWRQLVADGYEQPFFGDAQH